MRFERFDVVVVPFPFTDRDGAKRRPAVVVSDAANFNAPSGHAVMAMITSAVHAPWPLDVSISDLGSAGLDRPCVVRMKVFTLDLRFVLRRSGHLAPPDASAVSLAFETLLGRGPSGIGGRPGG